MQVFFANLLVNCQGLSVAIVRSELRGDDAKTPSRGDRVGHRARDGRDSWAGGMCYFFRRPRRLSLGSSG